MDALDAFDEAVPYRPFPEVSPQHDVMPFVEEGIGVYNCAQVYGDFTYLAMELTPQQRDCLAEFHYTYFDKINPEGKKGKLPVGFSVKTEIASDEKWAPLKEIYGLFDTALTQLGGKIFFRTDDASPKDVHREVIESRA